jgi:hypothetical protein
MKATPEYEEVRRTRILDDLMDKQCCTAPAHNGGF